MSRNIKIVLLYHRYKLSDISLWLSLQNPICIPVLPVHVICPAHLIFSNYVWQRVNVNEPSQYTVFSNFD
jgi:hypothetical protein